MHETLEQYAFLKVQCEEFYGDLRVNCMNSALVRKQCKQNIVCHIYCIYRVYKNQNYLHFSF